MVKYLTDQQQLKHLRQTATQIQTRMQQILQQLPKTQTEQFQSLRQQSDHLKQQVQQQGLTDKLVHEAYAVLGATTTLVQGKTPYEVQIMGALMLNQNVIAEMHTGEGKTLTALMPLYANALVGKGAHLVTANPYLAKRDADEARPVFEVLGMTVGYNSDEIKASDDKCRAYQCDITYLTGSELGFDYLKDNLVPYGGQKVQRGLYYVLIDEADATLLDNAQSPLVIAGDEINVETAYIRADMLAQEMQMNAKKYVKVLDDKKQVLLTKAGIQKVKEYYGADVFKHQRDTLHYVNNALAAHFLFHRGVDYLVRFDPQEQTEVIELIDTHTGRISSGRRYNDGMHQALEAKENRLIHLPTQTNASITYQSLFSLYDKVAGMTGTAKTDATELDAIYNLRVFQVPPHKPIKRVDLPDKYFRYQRDKYQEVIKDVKYYHQMGLPLLVATASVESSEKLSKLFDEAHLPHETLNARNPEREAKIIAKSGHKGAITIATNMAGRGTDIKVDPECLKLGGLVVLGTEHHDSLRVDDQLRGRAGRQGQPGITLFYGSLEDDLFKQINPRQLKRYQKRYRKSHHSLPARQMSRYFAQTQQQISRASFENKRADLVYEAIIGHERTMIYQQRALLAQEPDMQQILLRWLPQVVKQWFQQHQYVSLKHLRQQVQTELLPNYLSEIPSINWQTMNNSKAMQQTVLQLFRNELLRKEQCLGELYHNTVGKWMLITIDFYWKRELSYLEDLKRMITYQSYKQSNPYVEYQEMATASYNRMCQQIKQRVLQICLKSRLVNLNEFETQQTTES